MERIKQKTHMHSLHTEMSRPCVIYMFEWRKISSHCTWDGNNWMSHATFRQYNTDKVTDCCQMNLEAVFGWIFLSKYHCNLKKQTKKKHAFFFFIQSMLYDVGYHLCLVAFIKLTWHLLSQTITSSSVTSFLTVISIYNHIISQRDLNVTDLLPAPVLCD